MIPLQLDPITQQYYLRARYYNPVIARFTQEDVYRGDGLNLYAYCENNPVMYYDPSGYTPECLKEAYKQRRAEGMNKEDAYQAAKKDVAAQKVNQPPKPQPKKPNDSANQKKDHGGYKVNDSDRHGTIKNPDYRAEGHSSSKEDGRVQSHHVIQDKWAQKNVPGYNRENAPTILLPTTPGSQHSTISGTQNARRNNENPRYGSTSIQEEFNNSYSEMIEAKVDEKAARKAIKKAYKYFDSLGAFQ